MAVTLKCPDCGHTMQAADETPQTCPQCDGIMTKLKYQAKTGPASADKAKPKPKPVDEDDEEVKPKPKLAAKPAPKAKAKPAEDEDEEEKPKPKKAAAKPKQEALSLDDEDGEEEADDEDFERDGKIAKRVGVDPGFKNRALMEQVGEELARGEVLHWAGRPSLPVVKKHALMVALGGLVFSLIGGGILAFMLTKKDIPPLAMIVPGIFILVGILIAIFGPMLKIRQARHGWYAITDRRAIVCEVYPWGKKGKITNYKPNQLQNTSIKKSFWLKGAGSLVFRAEIHITTTHHTDSRGRSRGTSTSQRVIYYGFLDIEEVDDVGTVLRDVMFGGESESDEDD